MLQPEDVSVSPDNSEDKTVGPLQTFATMGGIQLPVVMMQQSVEQFGIFVKLFSIVTGYSLACRRNIPKRSVGPIQYSQSYV